MTSPFKTITHTIHASHIREYARATSTSDAPLLLSVKQYVPFDCTVPEWGDVTFIATHGSGMPKELYEPLFEALYIRSKRLGFKIRSIWIADAVHQGESGMINEGKLGNDPSWFDHARDIIALVNHFHAQMSRPIIGVGHSMGGGSLVLASLMHPRLFTSLLLLEPVFDKSIHECQGPALARASTFRRDMWESLDEAEAAARKRMKGWDPRVFRKWMEYGYRAVPSVADPGNKDFDPVTLKTSKHQEVFSYLRPNFDGIPVADMLDHESTSKIETSNLDSARGIHGSPDVIGPENATSPFYRAEPVIAYSALPHLRPSVLYVFGAKSPLATAKLRHAKLERTGVGISGSGGAKKGRVKEVVISAATHLLPLEKVEECADSMAVWLEDEVGTWVAEERRLREEWDTKTMKEKTTVSAEWIERIRSML
ncbi:putative toxin biosynthesis protein [Phaeosphaeria sp. MPI-PUGE-AT-0046c]|nr:putative toxin biosynthesis protein [Phaeosphaeria sp. MPI-PUGE-AT-0046c]